MKKYVRLPATTDRSLRAWSAVDEYILRHIEEEDYDLRNVTILHDRFGYLNCHLSSHKPTAIIYLESQKKSIFQNAADNWISTDDLKVRSILDDLPDAGKTAIMKVPKSLDLFRLYLIKLVESIPSNGVVITGFMTRHFIKSILDIASEYFGQVEQSKAWKKSRLLILSNPIIKKEERPDTIKSIVYNDYEYKQYLGVFSANHIDYATQFLLEHLVLHDSEQSFLDIGCGNGVIAKHLLDQRSWTEGVMMDDSILATASTAMNISVIESIKIITQYNLEPFADEQFDLVITNPPFHFEYEVDPSIAVQIMQDSRRILSSEGRLIVVANRHLNYKTQLSKSFETVNVIAENDKFLIYEARR